MPTESSRSHLIEFWLQFVPQSPITSVRCISITHYQLSKITNIKDSAYSNWNFLSRNYFWMHLSRWRSAHKWAAPPSPNMESIKHAVNQNLSPIYFSIRNDISAGPWNTDQNFYGILCSPKFEGKDYKEMYSLLNEALKPIGMSGRCRFSLEPPSRWNVCDYSLFSSTFFICRGYTERSDGSGV